jgi:glycosyltransferase involved in cell wall biosynthesis
VKPFPRLRKIGRINRCDGVAANLSGDCKSSSSLLSFEEPFGLVLAEAMAMKRPVVALTNGGTASSPPVATSMR